jgi:uncharacterized protein (TIGR03083 family)
MDQFSRVSPARRWRRPRSTRQNRGMTPGASGDKRAAVWAKVAEYRRCLADELETLTPEQWEWPSWCTGWRVRDVLGHLVHLAEASQVSMVRDLIHHPVRPDRALDLMARRLGEEPVPTLAQRLRQAHGKFHVLGFPPAVAFGEVIVHGNDALRALGLEFGLHPDDAVPVLNAYRRIGGVAFHARPHRHVRLVATDVQWSCGSGPEVTGRAVDLLMLIANRRQVFESLSGPGVADVAA